MNALVPKKVDLWIPVRVRIEAKTYELVREAARQMGAEVGRIYPMRGGQGYMGYGVRRIKV